MDLPAARPRDVSANQNRVCGIKKVHFYIRGKDRSLKSDGFRCKICHCGGTTEMAYISTNMVPFGLKVADVNSRDAQRLKFDTLNPNAMKSD